MQQFNTVKSFKEFKKVRNDLPVSNSNGRKPRNPYIPIKSSFLNSITRLDNLEPIESKETRNLSFLDNTKESVTQEFSMIAEHQPTIQQINTILSDVTKPSEPTRKVLRKGGGSFMCIATVPKTLRSFSLGPEGPITHKRIRDTMNAATSVLVDAPIEEEFVTIDNFRRSTIVGLPKKNHKTFFSLEQPLKKDESDTSIDISSVHSDANLLHQYLEIASQIWEKSKQIIKIRGDIHSFNAKKKWKFAINTILKLLMVFKYQNGPYHGIHIHSHKELDGQTIFKMYKLHSNIVTSSKLQYYFNLPEPLSGILVSNPVFNQIEIDSLKKFHILTKRVNFFKKFTFEQCTKLLKYVSFEYQKKDTMLIRQGHRAQYIYIVLSGQVQIIKLDIKDSHSTVGYAIAGDGIALEKTDGSFQEKLVRNMSAKCTTDCELLSINRKERPSVMRQVSLFQAADLSLLEQTQGQHNTKLYWILSGSVRLDKKTGFITRNGKMSLARPDTVDEHITAREKRELHSLTISVLDKEKCFPEPLPLSVHIPQLGSDKLDLLSKLSDNDALMLNKSTVTVTAESQVACLVMERIDFVRIMSWDMFDQLIKANQIYYIKPREIQTQWILVKKWEAHKKHVIKDVMKSISQTRDRRSYDNQQTKNKYWP
ncbi:hypothetical protein HDV02_006500 [Globomyces sp. JEL0801]|nr:hypothetical protein HDV02_006500 [Globomyces sp. JEL0801]